MELAFATKALRDICENEVLAYQEFEADIAKALISRLADLRAVDTLDQLPVGNPQVVYLNDKEYLEIEITNGVTIVICANHNKNPMLPSNDIAWVEVRRIKIFRIGDFYG